MTSRRQHDRFTVTYGCSIKKPSKNDGWNLRETRMDKSRFAEYDLPGDAVSGYGWVMSRLWNDKTAEPYGFFASQRTGDPYRYSFDLGQVVQLSRYKGGPTPPVIYMPGITGRNGRSGVPQILRAMEAMTRGPS